MHFDSYVGAEHYIMSSFPFTKYSFKILTIERPNDLLKQLLIENGYEEICSISVFRETLWVSTSIKSTLPIAAIMDRCYKPDVWRVSTSIKSTLCQCSAEFPKKLLREEKK